ncbi:MAG: fibronectin [Calditrichaeota bacterium]|nr:fibronectin [Calditrichota bacterium]
MTKIKYYLLTLLLLMVFNFGKADETKWLAVGMLHDWFSSTGCEIEVGRRHLISDQQDGLRWPAQFRYQDTKAAKALWIGTTNYQDPISGETYDYKVVHVGPRVMDEDNEFMPVEFKLVARFDHPQVLVDGFPASPLDYMDEVDEIDPDLPADRMLYNVVNTQIGVTVTRRVYAYSQQNHDNYLIYDYVFKNTGIIDKKGTKVVKKLTGVVFFLQYRYAPTREIGPYGYYWAPQSTSWGHSTMNDAIYADPSTGDPVFRALFTWLGRHSKADYDLIGGPNVGTSTYRGDGRLGGAQYCGVLTLHADKSATDKSDDPSQPTSTHVVGSDDDITYNNDPFNPPKMTKEYAAMTAGRPALSHAQLVGDGNADEYGNTPGGFSQAQGFGPYDLEPGDSIHIVLAEAVAGLRRDSCYTIGAKWFDAYQNPSKKIDFRFPNGSVKTGNYSDGTADDYKDAWVYTGRDSLFKTFKRAINTFQQSLDIPLNPPPPDQLRVESGGDRIILKWSDTPETWQNFGGYRVYRAIHTPDTTYDMLFECGKGTDYPDIVHEFEDKTAQRGFDYYYYVVSFDDGSVNDIYPGVPLESGRFYCMTNKPASLKRAPGNSLADIRIVPNPYNRRAINLQYGYSAPDRIMFMNIPPKCRIKIYTERGDLIKTIEHTDGSGDEAWNSVTSSRQVVVSGLYIAVFEVTENYYDPETRQFLFKKGDKTIRKFVIIR